MPPRIKVRGAGRAKGIPTGYILGRVDGGVGDVQLIRPADFTRLGIQPAAMPALLGEIPAETILANPGPGDAAPIPLTMSAILDFISTNQGDILYRNASDWLTLPPGTLGQVLTTGGPSADPSWEDSSGGGSAAFVWDDGAVPAGNTESNSTGERPLDSEYTFVPGTNPLLLNDVVRVTLRGTYGTDATPPDLTVTFKFNSDVLITTGAVTMDAGASGKGWEAHLLLFLTEAGASGEAEIQGSAQLNGYQGMVNTAKVPVDTTVDQRLRVFVEWSAADADNTITLRQFGVEHLAGNYTAPPAPVEREFALPSGDFLGIFINSTTAVNSGILPSVYVNEV